jgi:hypothetical protein
VTAVAVQRVALVEQIVNQLHGSLSDVDSAVVREAVTGSAHTVPNLTGLLVHLSTHPDALTSGSAEAPISLVRLAHALSAAGLAVVRLPGCGVCGRVTANLRGNAGPALACLGCCQDLRRQECARCGQVGRINVRGVDGPICNRCYQRDTSRHEPCHRCGRVARVAYRDEQGRPWCAPCYPRPERACTSCGTMAPTTAFTDAGPVCPTCYYKHHRPQRPCGRCDRVRPIMVRATETTPDLCYSCNQGPERVCSGCGRLRPCGNVSDDGGPLCQRCYTRDRRPRRRCDFCGQLALITARWATGAVCAGCYPRIRSRPMPCPGCGQERILTGIDAEGRGVCGQCAGDSPTYLCTRCGQASDGYVRGLCSCCALHQRVDALLTGPGGQIPEHLAAIGDRLRRSLNAKSALTWLDRSGGARVLAELARHDGPITHELLDGFPRTHYANLIRLALVHSGVLAERVELLEQVETWLPQFLTDRPRRHTQLLRPFAQWVVLRRARQRVRLRRPFTEGAASWARQQIRVAADLLVWLDERELILATLTQNAVDEWLGHGGSQRYTVRYFLIWARQHRLAPAGITVPLRQSRTPEQRISEDQRWTQLRSCLHDTALPLRLRVAGALLLLYGQPVSRIVRITTSHLDQRGPDIYLTINRRPTLLPTGLAALVDELSRVATPKSFLAGRGSPTTLLFPGQVPGQHLTVNFLVRELNQYGIYARPARNTALLDLAGDLPAAVLADLLGMHINTATRWIKKAKRDWTGYLAARATTPR